jgi:hypothetical protein
LNAQFRQDDLPERFSIEWLQAGTLGIGDAEENVRIRSDGSSQLIGESYRLIVSDFRGTTNASDANV